MILRRVTSQHFWASCSDNSLGPIYNPRWRQAPLAQEHNTIGLEWGPLDTQASSTLTVNIGAYEGAYRRGKIMNCTQKVDRDMLQWNVPSNVSTFRPPLLQKFREGEAYCRKFTIFLLSSLETKESVWTLSQNLYISQQTNTGTLEAWAIIATMDEPTRDLT